MRFRKSPYLRISSVNRASTAVTYACALAALAFGAETGRAANSSDPAIYFTQNEAAQLLARKKWAEAVIAYKNLLAEDPTRVEVLQGLSTALAQSGRREEALQTLIRASQKTKGADRAALVRRINVISRTFFANADYQTYLDALTLMSARKFGPASEKLYKVMVSEIDNVEILIRLGQLLVQSADYDSAAERLRTAKRLNPYEPEIALWLGRALHYRGELTEAIGELRSAHEGLPESELAAIWLSEALFSLGQRNLAMATLNEDVKARPMHVSSLLALARLKMQAVGPDLPASSWSARKDLQLALSRLDQYVLPENPSTEGELGLDLRPSAEQMRAEIQKLMEEAEARSARGGEPKALPSPR